MNGRALTLSAVDVRWPAYDAAGAEKLCERSHDIMRLGDESHARIGVAVTRTR